MHHPTLSQRWLDRWFNFLVAIKGFDGVLETVAGVVLLAIPTASLHGLLHQLTTIDATRDNDLLARMLHGLSHDLSGGSQLFVALYLLVHGVVKVALVVALLSRRYILYPYAIVVLVGFTIYQIYQLFTMFSLLIVWLTVLDVVVVWLTILEYQRHRPRPGLPTS